MPGGTRPGGLPGASVPQRSAGQRATHAGVQTVGFSPNDDQHPVPSNPVLRSLRDLVLSLIAETLTRPYELRTQYIVDYLPSTRGQWTNN